MSIVTVVALVVSFLAGISLFLVSVHNKRKLETMKKLLRYFSQLGSENQLKFSSQEVLKSSVLGLDGVQRKVLVVQRGDGYFESFIVDLRQVKNWAVKRIYGSINAGEFKNRRLEQFLEKIVLHFDLNNNSSGEIVFYKHFENHPPEALELERKAKTWNTILSKMQMPMKNIA